jgi:hypothetical protein
MWYPPKPTSHRRGSGNKFAHTPHKLRKPLRNRHHKRYSDPDEAGINSGRLPMDRPSPVAEERDAIAANTMEPTQPPIPARGIIPLDFLLEEEEQDTEILGEMAMEAQHYLESFEWCNSIEESFFGDGIPDVVAVFLFRIEPSLSGVDNWVWVVVGDLPPAFFSTHEGKTSSQVLEAYIQEMSKWVELARQGKTSDDIIAVDAPATPENAEDLAERLRVLSETVVPAFRGAEAELA